MSMQPNQAEPTTVQAGSTPAIKPMEQKPTHRAVSDPREVATLVMTRMNLVNAKKDELAIAIHGLVDITQQLTRTYAEQLLAIEQLPRRGKALVAVAASSSSDAPSTVQ